MEIEPSTQQTWSPSINKDTLLYIFNFLEVDYIVNAGLVCKFWNKVSKDDLLWKGERGNSNQNMT